MGVETYQIVIIVLVVVLLVAMIILAMVKKRRRQVITNQNEIRTVSTIQRVYYEPAKYTQYPTTQNTNPNVAGPGIPGWNITNLDGPTSSVSIRQPGSSVVIQRDPVMFSQPGYPPYPTNEPYTPQPQPQGYGQPSPYNPAYSHSSTSQQ